MIKTIKKMIAVATAIVCLTSSIVFAEFSDVVGTKYEEAIDYFCDIGLVQGYIDGEFKTGMPITRGEFVDILIKTIGYDTAHIDNSKMIYSDVSAGTDLNAKLAILSGNNVVHGYENEEFRSGDNIVYAEAIKMVVNILGYTAYAEHNGGYPYGYCEIASNIGLVKNVSAYDDISREDAYLLLYKALDINLVDLNYSDKSLKETNETILSRMGIEKKEGVLIATDVIQIVGDYMLDENSIVIDYERYTTNISRVKDLVGYKIKYFVDEDGRVIAITSAGNKYELIESEDIVEWNDRTTLYALKGEKEKKEKYNIDKNAFICYNGRMYNGTSSLIPMYGKVKLIDNNKDNIYEVVIINSYDTYVVQSSSTIDNSIVTKSGEVFLIDENDSYCETKIFKGSEQLSVSAVMEWDIIMVCDSKNDIGKKQRIVYVSDKKVVGKISNICKEKREIVIDDVIYMCDKKIINSVYIGETGIFYLDIFDRIVSKKNGEERNYGFLLDVKAYDDENTGVPISKFKIFTKDGNLIDVFGTEKIKYSEGEFSSSVKIDSLSLVNEKLKTNGETNKQTIIYDLNSEGKLNKIITAKSLPVSEWNPEIFSYNTRLKNAERASFYINGKDYQSENNATGYCYINSETYAMWIDPENEENCKAGIISEVWPYDKNVPYVDVYDWDEFMTAKLAVIVIDDSVSSITTSDPTMVVKSVDVSYDEEEEEIVLCVKGISNGEFKEILVYGTELIDRDVYFGFFSGTKLSGVKAGDVIQYHTNYNGRMTEFRKIYEPNGKDVYKVYSGSGAAKFYVANGIVEKKSKDFIRINNPIDGINMIPLMKYNFKVYLYDVSKKSISLADLNDISAGTKLFVNYRSETNSFIMIIKE